MVSYNRLYPKQSATDSPILSFASKQDSVSVNDSLLHDDGSSTGVYSYLNSELDTLKKRVKRLEEQPVLCSSKIYGLTSDKFTLKCPVDVVLSTFQDEVLATIPDLEIYGEGTTEVEALNDLEDELIDLYEYLHSIPSKNLGKIPQKWLKIINFLIGKRNGY